MSGVLCTGYVLLPSLCALISMCGLTWAVLLGDFRSALVFLFVSVSLGAPGIPIAVLQIRAIFGKSAAAARVVSIVLTFIIASITVVILGSALRAMDSNFAKNDNDLTGTSLVVMIGLMVVNSLAA